MPQAMSLTDLVAHIRTCHRAAAAAGRIEYHERGEIQHMAYRHKDSFRDELLDRIASWDRFPIPFISANADSLNTLMYSLPNVWWIDGRRHHRAAFWKALSVVAQYASGLVWRRCGAGDQAPHTHRSREIRSCSGFRYVLASPL